MLRAREPGTPKRGRQDGCAEEWGSVGTVRWPGDLAFGVRGAGLSHLARPSSLARGEHLYVPHAMAVCVGMSMPTAIALVSRFTLIAAPVK